MDEFNFGDYPDWFRDKDQFVDDLSWEDCIRFVRTYLCKDKVASESPAARMAHRAFDRIVSVMDTFDPSEIREEPDVYECAGFRGHDYPRCERKVYRDSEGFVRNESDDQLHSCT